MQVSKNTTIYMGQNKASLRHMEEQQQKNSKRSGSFNMARMLSGQEDSILMKKQLARKQAYKIVGDTFASDRTLDVEQDARRERQQDIISEKRELKDLMAAYEDMPEEEMTEEMLAEKREAMQQYQKQLDALDTEMGNLQRALHDTEQGRLEKSPMREAQEMADEILEAASKEIIGMAWAEAKDHIDEEQKKREEQAEKAAEKKEELEEKLEKAKEDREEAEELTEAIKEATSMDDVKREINEMLDKMKLIEEDIKGAKVDEML